MTEPAIDTGEILEALNDKVDRDCRNVDTTSGADVVIEYQIPTAENNYTWYRLYKSGWVEQGGKIVVGEAPTTTTHTMVLPIAMADTNYNVMVEGISGDTSSNTLGVQYAHFYYGAVWNTNKKTTSFNYRAPVGGCWKVEGMSAQS